MLPKYTHAYVAHFWTRVVKDPGDGCWVWQASKTTNGYGSLAGPAGDGQTTYAHRVAWELATDEPLPADAHVLHTCDYPACVRNDDAGTYAVDRVLYRRFGHLFLGSPWVNAHDRVAKRRGNHGARNGVAKLTDAAVRRIRADFAAGGWTMTALAHREGVGVPVIHRVIRRNGWLHVDDSPPSSMG